MAFERIRPPTAEDMRHAELLHLLNCAHFTNPRPFTDFLPNRGKFVDRAEVDAVSMRKLLSGMTNREYRGGKG